MQNWASNIEEPQPLALFAPCDFWEWVTRCIASQRQILSNANFRLPLWLCCNSWRHCRKQKNADITTGFLSRFLARKYDYVSHRSHQTVCGLPRNRINPSSKSTLYFNTAAYPIQIQFKYVKENNGASR